jgi:isoleucyl-tRNA synthetase
VKAAIEKMGAADFATLEQKGEITICNERLEKSDIVVKREPTNVSDKNIEAGSDGSVLLLLDFTSDEALQQMALAREVANRVQKSRKKANLVQDDPIDMWAEASTPLLFKALKDQREYIDKCLRRPLRPLALKQGHEVNVLKETFDINGEQLTICLSLEAVHFNHKAIEALCPDPSARTALTGAVLTYELPSLKKTVNANKGRCILLSGYNWMQ